MSMSEWRRAKRREVRSLRRKMTRRVLFGLLAAAVLVTGGIVTVKALRNRSAYPAGPAGLTSPTPDASASQNPNATPTAPGAQAPTPTVAPSGGQENGGAVPGTPGDGSGAGTNGTGAAGNDGNGTGAGTGTGEGTTVTGVLNGLTIGIDPGHQAAANTETEAIAPDSSRLAAKMPAGSTGVSGQQESEINLQIALILRDRLESLGAKVVLTRDSQDVDLSNQQRAAALKEGKCDLVMQLHCDAERSGTRTGIYMTYRPDDVKSSQAASKLQLAMGNATGAKQLRNMTSVGDTFLNWSEPPALLVQMGFLSNSQDAQRLTDAQAQKKLAEAMAEGIQNWYKAKKVDDLVEQK